MKLMHLSDLHLGKRVNEFSMLEDQKYILKKILKIADDISPDGLLIAGDIYDKSIPSSEAVELFDEFLTGIAHRRIPCFVISGNHDSAERIAFGSSILSGQRVYMSKVFDGTLKPEVLEDEYGKVFLYILPFLKPAHVRRFYPESEVETFEDAIRTVIESAGINYKNRNVLIAHQFITSAGKEPQRSESEVGSVGGLDQIDATILHEFDYVALGHLHGPQGIGRDSVRYAGSPLKYSFSEAGHSKSVTVIHLGEKEQVRIDTIPLTPLRDMREIRGPLDALLTPDIFADTNTDDYLHVTLTDEDEILDALGRLHTVYPNVMRIDYDNQRSRSNQSGGTAENISQKKPMELFEEFYLLQNSQPLDEEKQKIVQQLLFKLGGELG